MKPSSFLFVLLALAGPVSGLNPDRLLSQIHKRHWQIEDGLPHNYVNAIAHSPDGYLLIGTDEGLARFDGVRFSTPALDPALRLDRRWILSILPSRRGGYWVGTYDGSVYRIQDGAAVQQARGPDAVMDLLEDSAGALWYQAGEVHRLDPSGRDDTFPNCGGSLGNAWQVFAQDARGAVWIAGTRGVCRYRGGTAENAVTMSRSQGSALTLLAEPGGSIWLGTSRGLFRIAHPDSAPLLVPQPGVPGPVSCLLRDRDGALWAGTWGKGLFRITPAATSSWSSRDGLPDDFVRTLFEDREGNLWFGSRSGGLNRWKDTLLDPFGIPEGLRGNFASAVSGDGSGTVWLGTYRSGLYQVRERAIAAAPTPVPPLDLVIGSLAHDRAGNLWLGAWYGFFRYGNSRYADFSDRLPPGCDRARAVAVDTAQRLWIGCSAGLFRYATGEPQAGAAKNFAEGKTVNTVLAAADGSVWAGTDQGLIHVADDRIEWLTHGLPDLSVRYITEDSVHRIWITTGAPGLVLVQGGSARTLDTRNGLPGHPLYKPIDDKAGSMWISSSRGLIEVPAAQLAEWAGGRRTVLDAVAHDLDDGMRSIECHGASQPGGWLNSDGTLWFPTVKGFVRVQPSLRRRRPPPAVVIEEARAGGKVIAAADLRLAPGSRDLEVRFTALRFGSPDHVRFRYRLEGADSEWSPAGPDRVIRFTSLPPGKYRLLIGARDAGGDWSAAPAVLAIEQLPRFHQTAWFKLLTAGAIAALAAALYGWKIHRLRARYAAVTAERNRIAREWHDTLLAGLSGISWQLESLTTRLRTQPEQAPAALDVARKMVEHCSSEARRVIWDLRDSGPENQPLPEAVAAFLAKLCEGTAIRAVHEVRGLYTKLPYHLEHSALRVAQEAIANAVRHASPSRVEVLLEYTAGQLMLQVRDDGTGFVPRDSGASGAHFGILGMRERVLSCGGEFRIESAPGQGTRAYALFPASKGIAR